MTWRFLSRQLVEEMHREQLRRHGGAQGLRDEGALESALARAENKASYGCNDVCELAAAYLFGLAKNHAFIDGNKRIAIVSAGVFLMSNGFVLETDDARLYQFVLAVAAGDIDEDGARRFFQDHVVAMDT
ncbi:type II toxin-antitoxin system death-on-curing family toxin [Pararhizobium haloflavum]|uniref:type II toxin-antitoxin system death-on-curing family toxin n=1 Tax=Pararhizobium haloflavum TaxID=2037914 RepID=UPI000C178004|nr:type II toxin-antitoxin system death-on-curing family toxin [Pararhizobium haloflavum]